MEPRYEYSEIEKRSVIYRKRTIGDDCSFVIYSYWKVFPIFGRVPRDNE